MKNVKVTRLKLDVDPGFDYILIGLVSSEPDYKISLALNKKFGILLRNVPGIKTDDYDQVFSKFSYVNNQGPTFNLISNRAGKVFLLSKLKNIDFLLQIMDYENVETITTELRKIGGITAVFNIDTDNLKDKNLGYL